MIASDCQHEHLQPPTSNCCIVIDHIAIECRKLGKPRVHVPRLCIEFRIVRARGLVELCRVCGKVIPEAIEIDALTARDQPLHVDSAKPEMPQQRAFQNIIPRPNPRDGSVHHHELCSALRIPLSKCKSDHVADVMTDNTCACHMKRVQNVCNVFGLIQLLKSMFCNSRQTHATKIRHDHRMIGCERGGKRRPHIARVSKAMQQHHGRSRSANPDMKRCSVSSDLLNTETARVRLDVCSCGQRCNGQQEGTERFPRHGPLRESISLCETTAR